MLGSKAVVHGRPCKQRERRLCVFTKSPTIFKGTERCKNCLRTVYLGKGGCNPTLSQPTR